MLKKVYLTISLLILITACGGSGDSSSAAGSSGSSGSSASGGAAQGYQVQEKIQAVD